MPFAKPLKVFLSYIHSDDPDLFREFRNQLTALEDDGISNLDGSRHHRGPGMV